MIRALLPVVALFALFFLALPTSVVGRVGGPGGGSATEQIGNSLCPVTGDEEVDPTIFTEFRGERVYFCCQRCRNRFLANPGDYLDALPQFAATESSVDLDREPDHDHADHDAQPDLSPPARAVRFAGKSHVVAVHFPIALLLSALGTELLGASQKRRWFRHAARAFVILGAPLAVFTALVGWAAGFHAGYSGEMAEILQIHRWLGTATAVGAVTTLVFSERHWQDPGTVNRRRYQAFLVVTAALVGITGHFGGTLIYGTEHFTW